MKKSLLQAKKWLQERSSGASPTRNFSFLNNSLVHANFKIPNWTRSRITTYTNKAIIKYGFCDIQNNQ